MYKFSRLLPALAAAVLALLCSACGQNLESDQDNSSAFSYEYETKYTIPPFDPSAVPKIEVMDMAPETQITSYGFQSAIWLAKDAVSEEERYFCFTSDTAGKVVNQSDGTETAFTFEPDENGGTFRFGAGISKVTMSWGDSQHVIFAWEDGHSESVTFLRENGSEPLQFYNNAQLCTMAQDDYAARTGKRPENAQALYNYDDKIAIQLYAADTMATSTYDWYTVDRYTAKGYNTDNLEIDLTAAPAAPTASAAAQPTEPVTAAPPTEPPTQAAPPAQAQPVADTLPPAEQFVTEAEPQDTVPEGMEGMIEGREDLYQPTDGMIG